MSVDYLAATKYAKALMALAEEKKQEDLILEELLWVAEHFGKGEGLAVLAHPLLSTENKKEIFQSLLKDNVSPLIKSLITLLIDKRRGVLLAKIAEAYSELYRSKKSLVEAKLSSAMPLTKAQIDQLKLKLEMITGKDINLSIEVDPQLKAGAKVALGDLILDGTLKGRIEQLRKSLMREN